MGEASLREVRPVVIELDRELTVKTVEGLRVRLWVEVAAPLVVLDLGKVEIVTTPVIGLFVEFLRAVQSNGGRVVLARPSLQVAGVLRRLQFERLFGVTSDLESATQFAAP